MEVKVTRSEHLLNRIANKTGMTQDGKLWLTKAVDPFHDFQVAPAGYPDGEADRSVIKDFVLSMNVTRPATVPNTDNWDCLITIDDCPHRSDADAHVMHGTTVIASANPAVQGYYPYGGCTARSGPVGNDLTKVLSVGNTLAIDTIEIPLDSYQDKMRIISSGFEAHNTTAEYFKQGSVTVFEMPSSVTNASVVITETDAVVSTQILNIRSVKPKPVLPTDVAEATILTGSKSWEAREGCYVVGAMQDMTPRPRYRVPCGSLFFDPALSQQVVSKAGWMESGEVGYTEPIIEWLSGIKSPPTTFLSNYNTRGAYFTGLSPETSLTIYYRISIQSFPNPDSPLVSLAVPSPMSDIVAQAAYSEIMSRMPVGVKVKENGLGDWFTGAVAKIIDGVTGTPIASTIDRAQKNYLSSNSNQKKDDLIAKQSRQIEELEKKLLSIIQAMNQKNGRNSNNKVSTSNRSRAVKGRKR